MGIKISKAEFDALPDALKSKFTADGEDFALVEEDVEGLKKSKAEILAEKKAIADKLAALEKFKADFDAKQAESESEAMKAAGQFAELEKKLRDALAEQKTQAEQERAQMLETIKRERLTNELIARGVLPDRARYALADIEKEIILEPGDNGFALKVKDGIGDANEFANLVEGFKAKSPFLFAAGAAAGSGASGSGNGGSSGTMKRSTMNTKQKVDFVKQHGSEAFLQLPE
ncbi:MAG: hypothetical protein E6Q97_30985 [Desulfurellales bacterium]|nr:MAG: hypothetical protein E6Q97_30985 [Desulfurellales bacterium]